MNRHSTAGERRAATIIHELLLRAGILRRIPTLRRPQPKAPHLLQAGHRSGSGSDSIQPYLNR